MENIKILVKKQIRLPIIFQAVTDRRPHFLTSFVVVFKLKSFGKGCGRFVRFFASSFLLFSNKLEAINFFPNHETLKDEKKAFIE